MVKKLIVKNTRKAPIRRRAAEDKEIAEGRSDIDLLEDESIDSDTEELEDILESGNISEAIAFLGAEVNARFILNISGEVIDLKDPSDDIKALESYLDDYADFRGEENFIGNLASRVGELEETVKMLGIGEFLEDIKGDNSYNWTHILTPVNWNLYRIEETGEFVSEIKVNQGGDPRGNYGRSYYFIEDDEEAANQRLYDTVNGQVTISIEFQNGDYLNFDGESDTDRWNLNLSEESSVITSPETELIVEYFEALTEGSDKDEALQSISGI